MTRKEEFLKEIALAVHARDYVEIDDTSLTVYVDMPDLPYHEQIFNPYENMRHKHNYYKKAYDDDLRLRANPDIKIVKWKIE